MTTVTKTLTVIPSGYTGLTGMSINSSYPITRGYAASSDTTYTRFDVNQSTTGSVYFTFDTSDIPADATNISITGQFKARVSSTTRITNTGARLYAGTTAKGTSVAFASTTASVRSLTPGSSWTKSELNNLRLYITGTASSSTSSRRIDFYGADITITYSTTVYTVSASGDGTLDPSTSQNVESGDSYTLNISGLSSKPTVLDNNIDVTSSLTQTSVVSSTLIPNNYTNSGFTVSNITNVYNDATNDTYAQLTAPAGGSACTLYLDFEDLSIPSGATITSVTVQATLQFSRNNSSSGVTASCQMYAGSTAKGSSTTIVSSATDVAKTTYNLTVGSWTATELNNAKLLLTVTNNASGTQRYLYVYGASLIVNYESDGIIYVYTISNVTADHTIVVTSSGGGSTTKIYLKESNSWVQYSKVYKKINGAWVEQSATDIPNILSTTANYVKSN